MLQDEKKRKEQALACIELMPKALERGDRELLRRLLEGMDLNVYLGKHLDFPPPKLGFDNPTPPVHDLLPLTLAVIKGTPEDVALLLEMGAEPDARFGQPILYALLNGVSKRAEKLELMLRHLFEKGVGIEDAVFIRDFSRALAHLEDVEEVWNVWSVVKKYFNDRYRFKLFNGLVFYAIKDKNFPLLEKMSQETEEMKETCSTNSLSSYLFYNLGDQGWYQFTKIAVELLKNRGFVVKFDYKDVIALLLQGDTEQVKTLFDLGGVDPEEKNYLGRSLLIEYLIRVSRPDPAIIKFLLEKGANPRALDERGYDALAVYMEKNEFLSREVVNALLSAGADPNTHVYSSYPIGQVTPLFHLMLNTPSEVSIEEGIERLLIAKDLILAGASAQPNQKGETFLNVLPLGGAFIPLEPRSPLEHEAARIFTELVQLSLDRGEDLNQPRRGAEPPIFSAAVFSVHSCFPLKVYLDLGGNPNANVQEWGGLAHVVVRQASYKCKIYDSPEKRFRVVDNLKKSLQILLEKGIDPFSLDNKNQTPGDLVGYMSKPGKVAEEDREIARVVFSEGFFPKNPKHSGYQLFLEVPPEIIVEGYKKLFAYSPIKALEAMGVIYAHPSREVILSQINLSSKTPEGGELC